jgi:hypothetical protein
VSRSRKTPVAITLRWIASSRHCATGRCALDTTEWFAHGDRRTDEDGDVIVEWSAKIQYIVDYTSSCHFAWKVRLFNTSLIFGDMGCDSLKGDGRCKTQEEARKAAEAAMKKMLGWIGYAEAAKKAPGLYEG